MNKTQFSSTGTDKSHSSGKSFKYYYSKKSDRKESLFEYFKFKALGYTIYFAGLVCGFIGLCIDALKRDKIEET